MLQGLDAEAQRQGDGVDVFPTELVKDSCFGSVVRAEHARLQLPLFLPHLLQDSQKVMVPVAPSWLPFLPPFDMNVGVTIKAGARPSGLSQADYTLYFSHTKPLVAS